MFTYVTGDLLQQVSNSGYFNNNNPAHALPSGAGVGTVIKVFAGNGIQVRVISSINSGTVDTALLDPAASNLIDVALSIAAFKGLKASDALQSSPDNEEKFSCSDLFNVPAYIGSGYFFTSVKPAGQYFGEGVVTCPAPDPDFIYEIPLCSLPVYIGTPITVLSWKSNVTNPTIPMGIDHFEQYLSIAIGPKAGANFQRGTESTVALGYKALGTADENCDSSTAVDCKALAQSPAPIHTVAMGSGAMEATKYSDRNVCIGDGAGRWAGCDKPVSNNHDFFHADVDGVNDFHKWTDLDPNARNLVGPVGWNATPPVPPTTENAYPTSPVVVIPASANDNYLNVALGRDALNHNVKGTENTVLGGHAAHGWNINRCTYVGASAGNRALVSDDCVGIGHECLYSNVRGDFNTAGGAQAMRSGVFTINNTAWGFQALKHLTGYGNSVDNTNPTGASDQAKNNLALGYLSLTTLVWGTGNTGAGANALAALDHGADNTATGRAALGALVQGNGNTADGADALAAFTGQGTVKTIQESNTAVGAAALNNLTDGGNNTAIGRYAGSYASGGGSTPFTAGQNTTCVGYLSKVSGDNQVQLGNANATTYVFGTVQDRCDTRDKLDIRDTSLGLEFIQALRPREFRTNYQDAYVEEDGTVLPNDGSRAGTRFHQGLVAQEVKAAADQLGVDFGGYQDHQVNGGADVLTLGYGELWVPAIRAMQELAAQNAALAARVAELERLVAQPKG